jgi:aldose 1-epimerase
MVARPGAVFHHTVARSRASPGSDDCTRRLGADDAAMIGERTIGGFTALTLTAPGDGGLEAAFVPGAGMVGCSLRHPGRELLGQRGGLAAYVADRKTLGIPLLYPWANRLSAWRFPLAGREVAIDPAATPLRRDSKGLPMHGIMSAAKGWRVERHEATGDGGVLTSRFDFSADDALMAAFPFPHELVLEATLSGPTLRLVTTVHASGDAPVPIAFGFHPYLRLPGVAREEWSVEIPVRERLRLDPAMLPTGEREPVTVAPGPLGSRTFDDAYVAPPGGAAFALEGGGRRIELAFETGYPFAQVFAPAGDDVIAFEPMTAPTNALVDGGPELTLLAPGESYRAAFSIRAFTRIG